MKKQLIKEISELGAAWYYTAVDGEKKTPYTQNIEEARQEYEVLRLVAPSKEVIEEEEI